MKELKLKKIFKITRKVKTKQQTLNKSCYLRRKDSNKFYIKNKFYIIQIKSAQMNLRRKRSNKYKKALKEKIA